jgi:CRISPR/Cas system-associated exonuclease Cas4 (RecB family)
VSPGAATRWGTAYLSASEIGDYAYCPRSFWYRRHPPPVGRSAASRQSSEAGTKYHAAHLRAERHRAGRQQIWRTVLVIAAIVAVAALAGGYLV